MKTGISTRKRGDEWEQRAAQYLSEQGVSILEHSFSCRQGEVDLIGRSGDVLIFFEVKWRKGGFSADAVTASKQKKICRASDVYRSRNEKLYPLQVRYDVIAVDGTQFRWIRDAFSYQGQGYL